MSSTFEDDESAIRYCQNMPMEQFHNLKLWELQRANLSDSTVEKIAALVSSSSVKPVTRDELKSGIADPSRWETTLLQFANGT